MTGKLAKFTEDDYRVILTDLADGVPLTKSWGGNRPGKTLFHRKVATDAQFAQDYSRALALRASKNCKNLRNRGPTRSLPHRPAKRMLRNQRIKMA